MERSVDLERSVALEGGVALERAVSSERGATLKIKDLAAKYCKSEQALLIEHQLLFT